MLTEALERRTPRSQTDASGQHAHTVFRSQELSGAGLLGLSGGLTGTTDCDDISARVHVNVLHGVIPDTADCQRCATRIFRPEEYT